MIRLNGFVIDRSRHVEVKQVRTMALLYNRLSKLLCGRSRCYSRNFISIQNEMNVLRNVTVRCISKRNVRIIEQGVIKCGLNIEIDQVNCPPSGRLIPFTIEEAQRYQVSTNRQIASDIKG